MAQDGTKGKPGPKPGSPKQPGSGKKKGTLNKATQYGKEVATILKELDCCPFKGMALIGMRKIDCYLCLGEGEIATFEGNPDANEPANHAICPQCRGTGFEPIDPGVRNRAFSELAQYLAPKRKAIEQTNRTMIGVVIKDYRGADGDGGTLIEADESEVMDDGEMVEGETIKLKRLD